MLSVMIIQILLFVSLLALIFIPAVRPYLIGGYMLIMLGWTVWLVYQQDAANGVVYTANLADFSNKPDGVVVKHWIDSPFIAIPVGVFVFAIMAFVWIKLRFPTVRIEIEQPKEN